MIFPFGFSRSTSFVFLTLLLFLASLKPTYATYSYGNFEGQTMTFNNVNEANNSPDNKDDYLFGSPIVLGDRLLFFPTSFSSASVDGVSDITTGNLQTTIQAKPGTFIEKIRIEEFGDYLFTGAGGAETQADMSLYLTVTPLAPYGSTKVGMDAFNFELPLNTSGGFNAIGEVIFDTPVSMAMVSLINNLSTTSKTGTTAFIQKKVIDGPAISISVNPVPVPAALWLLVSGVIGLGAFRKKSV